MATEQKNDKVAVIEDSLDIFARFDQIDDQLIINEIEGRVVDVWVYHFPQDGKDIWGLAKEGVDQCAQLLGKKGIALRDDEVTFQEDPKHPEYVIFFAKVKKVLVDKSGNEAQVESAIGIKRQWIMRKVKTQKAPFYKVVTNQFWPEQGAIKALRNAKARLIPADIKAKVITNAKKLKKVRKFEEPKPEQKKKNQTAVQKAENAPSGESPATMKEPPPEYHEEQKEGNTNFPEEQSAFPEEPGKVVDKRSLAPQDLKMDINNLMARLIQRYGYRQEQLLGKMDEKVGHHTINEMTIDQAEVIKEFFEWVIDQKEAERMKKEKTFQ